MRLAYQLPVRTVLHEGGESGFLQNIFCKNNKKQEKFFIYNIKVTKMTMNVFEHEFFAAERAAAEFAAAAFEAFCSDTVHRIR